MGSHQEAPAELDVQADLDGFRCTLRPYNPPDDWLLLFVPLWWAAALGLAQLALYIDPTLADARIDSAPAWMYLAWPAAMLGWAPGFMLWRAWRRKNTMPLNLDPGRLTVGDQSWAVGDILQVEEERRGIRLTLRRGRGWVPMGSNGYLARRWVADQIEAAMPAEQPAPPEALQALRGADGD